MRRIGVIGCGVVGSAVVSGFEKRGFKVYRYDKNKPNCDDFPYILNTDAIFVCVPTPTIDGRQDLSALEEVFALLKGRYYNGIIVIKSTVLPGTTDALASKYRFKKVVHNPEFLTAANPTEDFMNQTAILIGGSDQTSLMEIGDLYYEARFNSIRLYPSAKITEQAKYMRNNFLAVKVGFFNEQYELCQHEDIDYDLALQAMLSVGGIEETHTRVPGPDGKLGFGGMCFPKDTQAQATFAQDHHGLEMDVLQGAIDGNKRRRLEAK